MAGHPGRAQRNKTLEEKTSMMGPGERIEYLTRELHRDHPDLQRTDIEKAVRTAAQELADTGNREEVRRIALTLLRLRDFTPSKPS